MGVVRYLCITILLVFLAASSSNAANANTPGCNMKGREDLTGACLCLSSFGGAHCENEMNATTCPGMTVLSPVVYENNEVVHKNVAYPYLDTEVNKVNFTANTLTFNIRGPVVANRSYTDVKFVSQKDASCGMGTQHSVWKLSSDQATCADRMALSLHWSNHSQCGFVKQPEPVWSEYITFKATVVVSYVDVLGAVGEDEALIPYVERRSSAAFHIYVNFPKFVQVNITEVVVYSQVNLTIAITEYIYDPATLRVTFRIATVVKWPNMIYDQGEYYPMIDYPDDLIIIPDAGHDLILINGGECVDVEGTPCLQFITLTMGLNNTNDCDFNGFYKLNMTVATCRGNTFIEYCTKDWFTAMWEVKESNICGEVTANPFVSGKLVGYTDETHDTETSQYLLGDRGFFAVELDAKNDLNLTFTDIWVESETSADDATIEKIYFYQNSAMVKNYRGSFNPNYGSGNPSVVDLKLSTETADVVIETLADGSKVGAPHFDFQFNGYVFRPEPGQHKVYVLHATGIITYLGNEAYPKTRSINTRVVDFVWKAETASMKSSMLLDLAAKEEESTFIPSFAKSAQSLSSVILPIAGVALVVVVGAIVVAVVIVKRKSSNAYTAFSN